MPNPSSDPMSEESSLEAEAPQERAGPAQVQQELRLDDANVSAIYANFCRLSGTPEEIVLDFALNTHPTGTMPETLKLNQRVIMNFFTAKRLLFALQMAVQRHEATFGVLETDIRRRVMAQGPLRSSAPQNAKQSTI